MTNMLNSTAPGPIINQQTETAIAALERMERVTFNNWQREAIRLLIQDERRNVELIAPRRSGKTFLCSILASRLGNDVGIIVPNNAMKHIYDNLGIDRRRLFSYSELDRLLSRGAPEIIICDEFAATELIMSSSRTKKILSIYTVDMLGLETYNNETNYVVPASGVFWIDEAYPEESHLQQEKEWDDATN